VTDVPKEHVDAVEKARNELIQQVSNIDDEVAEAVLEEREITPELLKAGIRRQTIANKFVPVIGGSALKNIRYSIFGRRGCRLPAKPARHSAGQRPEPRHGRANGSDDR
jgi:translation elongation factor EF-G